MKTDLVVPEVVHFTLEDGLPAVGDGDILHDRRKVRVESLLRNIRNQGFAITGPGKLPFYQLQSLTLCVDHGVGEHLLGVDHVVGQHRTLLPDPFLGEAVLRCSCTS